MHQQFASDNYAGVCPEALDCMIRANQGHDLSYGEDAWTREACDLFRELFETNCEVFFVFNGTAANSLALASLCHSYNGIVCHELAHVETDECGAPQFFSNGAKLLPASGKHGKINPLSIERVVTKRCDIHYPKPKVISLTQATELGTIYRPTELQAIHDVARKHTMKIHMDGARFANAVAALDVHPKEISWHCGVDVLCFGGSKNGMAIGEAVIFFNTTLSEEFAYRCKQAGQLAAKMRFLAAQWVGVLRTGAWRRYAEHANRCAQMLEHRLEKIPGIEIMFPRQANAVFVSMPELLIEGLRKRGWRFYTFIGLGGARLMCSWDTTEEIIRQFTNDIEELISKVPADVSQRTRQ